MRRPWYDCVVASIALALMLAVPVGAAFAQDSNKLAATFNERFPADEMWLWQRTMECLQCTIFANIPWPAA